MARDRLSWRLCRFTMLLTSTEQVSLDLVERKRFPGMQLEIIQGKVCCT